MWIHMYLVLISMSRVKLLVVIPILTRERDQSPCRDTGGLPKRASFRSTF